MGRIDDLRKLDEELDKEPTATATAIDDTQPPASAPEATPPPVATATDTATPPVVEPSAPVTVQKEVYDRLLSINQQLQAEVERLTAAHSTLTGKFNAEVPRLQAENKMLRDKWARHEVPGAGAPADQQTEEEKLEAIKGDFGQEFHDIVKASKLNEAALKAEIAELKAMLTAMQETRTTQQQPQRNRFLDELTVAAPNWKIINGVKEEGIEPNPYWPDFTRKVDPTFKKTYQEILDTHVNNGNVAGTAEVFKLFEGTIPALTIPLPGMAPAPTGKLKGVEGYVDPATSSGSTPPQGEAPKVIHGFNTGKLSEMQRYKADRTRGRLAHLTQAEIQQIEDGFDYSDAKGMLK